MDFNIGGFDIVIIVSYLVGIVLLGVFAIRKKMSEQTVDDYFLASRSLKWPIIGAALFAANISTIHLIGFAESGYNNGLVDGLFEWLAIPFLILIPSLTPHAFEQQRALCPHSVELMYP